MAAHGRDNSLLKSACCWAAQGKKKKKKKKKVWHPAETHSLIAGPDDRQGFDKFSPLLKATELYPCPPRGNVEEKSGLCGGGGVADSKISVAV